MRACFFVDTVAGMKPYKDTSLDLMVNATARGHSVFVVEGFESIAAGSAGVTANGSSITFDPRVREEKTLTSGLYQRGPEELLSLDEMDAIFIRNDPPFGMDYSSATLLLSPLEKNTVFVNKPSGLRRISEKLTSLEFSRFIPDTLASWDVDQLRHFAEKHDQVVLKPSYFGAGAGVEIAKHDDGDFAQKVQTILALNPRGPVIAQAFLPEVKDGDTRVMMVEGRVIGAVGRKPAEGDFRANVAMGGAAFKMELTETQRAAASEIGKFLKEHGIIFAGLDFIRDHLIEINVTSPTLVQELRRVGGPDVSEHIWEAVEARHAKASG